MNEVTGEWVTKADNDFYSADILLRSGDVPDIRAQSLKRRLLRKHSKQQQGYARL